MATYSNSKLSTFEQCKYKYKLAYIDNVTEDIPDTVEAFMGSRVHETLEKLYRDLGYQKPNTLKQILKFYNGQWKKKWSDGIIIVKSEYSKENYRKMGEKYITDYYNRFRPFDDMQILGVETKKMLTLPDGSRYHVRIDKLGCIGSTYYVCDYKTNKGMKVQEDADEDRQLAMYSIWVKNSFPDAKKVVLKWHMLAFDKDVVSERTERQLKALQEETMGRIREIEGCREYPTHVTYLCDYCGFRNMCPAFKHEVELEKKAPERFKKDSGVRLVDEYAKLEREIRENEDKVSIIKERLIQFARQKGLEMVYGSNKKASIREDVKVVIDPDDKEKIIRILKKIGLYEEFSTLDSSKLKSSIKAHEMDRRIAKLAKAEKAWRVSLSRRKNDDK
jgi:putative RecB family exonuclease